MRRLLLILLLSSTAVAQTLAHHSSGTATPLTITSTTSPNLIIVGVDSSTLPTSVSLTGGTTQFMTQVCTITNANCSAHKAAPGNYLSYWIVPGNSGSHTAASVTLSGSVTAVYEYELSGMVSTTATYDLNSYQWCDTTTGFLCQAAWTNSAANEVFVAMENCQGSVATSPYFTGSTWTNASDPNGEGGAMLITSSIALITALPDAACSSGTNAGIALAAFRASGATGTTCSWSPIDNDVSTSATGTNPTASKTVIEHNLGDLLNINAMCTSSCTPTVTFGSETVTQTSVTGTSSASTGQARQYYVLSTAHTGSASMSMATTGGATQAQISYREFASNYGCTAAHDVDSSVGTGTGLTANTPSYTPSAGDLAEMFTLAGTGTHVSSVNSPWSCTIYYNSTSNACEHPTTENADGFILGTSGSSISNNMSQLTPGGAWQAIGDSFTLTASSGTVPGQFPRVQ